MWIGFVLGCVVFGSVCFMLGYVAGQDDGRDGNV
jgi:hypothetical protein